MGERNWRCSRTYIRMKTAVERLNRRLRPCAKVRPRFFLTQGKAMAQTQATSASAAEKGSVDEEDEATEDESILATSSDLYSLTAISCPR
jgi:hypothetical protein